MLHLALTIHVWGTSGHKSWLRDNEWWVPFLPRAAAALMVFSLSVPPPRKALFQLFTSMTFGGPLSSEARAKVSSTVVNTPCKRHGKSRIVPAYLVIIPCTVMVASKWHCHSYVPATHCSHSPTELFSCECGSFLLHRLIHDVCSDKRWLV